MSHEETVIDQFTRQAEAFSSAPAMNDAAAMRLLVDAVDPTSSDVALDVACGPGITTAVLAAYVDHIVGVDVTQKMIHLAEERCARTGLTNTAFHLADASALPFDDGAFSLVVSRYALHHLSAPELAVAEMARVCSPGGRIAIIDIAADRDPEVAARFDEVELARDPSHVRALPSDEVVGLLSSHGLRVSEEARYVVPAELEALLARSASPEPQRVRELFQVAVDGRRMGVSERSEDGRIRFEYPISIHVGRRPEQVAMKERKPI